ncbi:uncharacterized protein LOC129731392 [Wyeomyia smithii]|uniref:uncharacterized protein LOC129731392 n=1 Tax=Wyeomyia smithii TaxID=174621 RepID=UPI002467E6F2|nr:uncharacterized protein LOC129731392 [Wyeomyia smithii]
MARHLSEKSLDEQQLLSPSEAYREILHASREADRRYLLSGEESFGDASGIFLDSSYPQLIGQEDESYPLGEYSDIPEDSFDVDKFLEGEFKTDWKATVEEVADTSEISLKSDDFIPQELKDMLEDSYFPGFLDDAVQGKVPFKGQVIVQEGDKSVIQETSLLEAFDKRVEYEQRQVKDRLGLTDFGDISAGADSSTLPVREEAAVAALTAINIDTKIRNRLDTELTKAIEGLTKAQAIHGFQAKQQAMKEMTKRVISQLNVTEPDEEGAAVGPRYPKFDVIQVGGPEDAMKPLEIISYIGSTRSKIAK